MGEIQNKKAYFDYEILETYEAGIVLVGCEVKSIRAGNASIKDCFARFKDDELLLTNMHITPYSHGNIHNPEETRERKLLMKRSEIKKLISTLQQKNLNLIPLKVYLKNKRFVKVLLGLARSKKLFDKKDVIKKRETDREIQRALRSRG